MELKQRRLSTRTTFSFGAEELRYSVKDASGANSFSVSYSEIPIDHTEIEERNAWLRNVGLIWVVLGIIQLGAQLLEDGNLRLSIWPILGIGCLLAYWFASVKYLVFATDKGRIFVIRNAKQDSITSEIAERRRQQWRRWYAEVNLANDPQRELGKFQWLRDKAVISVQEYDDAVAAISRHHSPPAEISEDRARTLN